jgi:hypothetical protein
MSKAKAKAPKKFPVVSSLDAASPSLVADGKALIGQGQELETAWFNNSVQMILDKKISVRGVQASMDEVLKPYTKVIDGEEKCDVKFPSLTETMVQYFVQAHVLMSLPKWKGSPVEAIRIVQSGKRSEAFESAKEFDGALATAKSATAIVAKAKQPKRASATKPKVETPIEADLEGKKVQTFSEAVGVFARIATQRTSHFLDEQASKDARFIIALLHKQLKAQESKDAEQVIAA